MVRQGLVDCLDLNVGFYSVWMCIVDQQRQLFDLKKVCQQFFKDVINRTANWFEIVQNRKNH